MKIFNIKTILFFLSLCLFSNSCQNKKISTNEKIAIKPKRTNQDNYKIIDIFDIVVKQPKTERLFEFTETLVSIEKGKYSLGDSTNYKLDIYGNIIKEVRFGSNGKLKTITTNEYDNKYLKTRMYTIGFDGETPFEILYNYNSAGQLISEVVNSNTHDSSQFVYDESNYLIKEIIYGIHDSVWRIKNYFYDTNGNQVKIIIVDNKNDTVSSFKQKFNSLNQCNESEKYGEPINCSGRNKWKYEYNEHGDVIKETTHDLIVRTTYEYDKYNNKLKEYSFHNEEKEPNFLIRRTFKYK